MSFLLTLFFVIVLCLALGCIARELAVNRARIVSALLGEGVPDAESAMIIPLRLVRPISRQKELLPLAA